MNYWLISWTTGWLVEILNWLIGSSTCWMVYVLVDPLVDWFIYWFIYWLVGKFIDLPIKLFISQLFRWIIWLLYILRLIACSTLKYRLFYWLSGWCRETMVPISNGNSEHVAHALGKIGLFGEKKSDWLLLPFKSNGLNRSNNRDCSLRAHLFLS